MTEIIKKPQTRCNTIGFEQKIYKIRPICVKDYSLFCGLFTLAKNIFFTNI